MSKEWMMKAFNLKLGILLEGLVVGKTMVKNFVLISRQGEGLIQKIPQGDEQMNQHIANLFPVTAEAVLVYKYFFNQINTPYAEITSRGKEKELLAYAKEQEAKL